MELTTGPRRGYYHGWNIVGVGALAQATAFSLVFGSFSLFLPYLSRDLHQPMSGSGPYSQASS